MSCLRSLVTSVFTVLGIVVVTGFCTGDPFRLDSDEFPVGMFSVDTPGAMAQVAKMGIDFIHTYATGGDSSAAGIRRDLAYLDQARHHGLRVMFNLSGRRWVSRRDGLHEMLTIADAVKDHPALGFWYLYDEPDGVHSPRQLRPFYRALHRRSPNIPVAVASAWSKKWYAYDQVLDLLMIDAYPVQHRAFPAAPLSVMTRFTEQALGLGKPVIPINQCFNWRVLAGNRKTYRGSPVARMRYPTKEEIRYWCYSEAAQGVRGLFWWSYSRSVQGGYGWINHEFAQVLREFRDFTRLTAPTFKPQVFPRARDVNVVMALWERAMGNYLVVVNSWPLERNITRWMEDKLQEAKLIPWGTTRDTHATLKDGRLTVGAAKPWEVFVWKVEPSTRVH